jgi:hypothetical protein
VQEQAFDCSDRSNHEQSGECSGLAFDAKRQHRRRKNKEGTRAPVDGLVHKPEQHHADDMRQGARVHQDKQAKIQEEKHHGPEAIEEPHLQADVVHDRLNEKEAEIDHPEQGTPSVVFIPENRVPRLQPQETAGLARFFGSKIGFKIGFIIHDISIVILALNSGLAKIEYLHEERRVAGYVGQITW